MKQFNRAACGTVFALAMAAGIQVFVAAAPASAATCRGIECDNVGPQGAGCFADDVPRASLGGYLSLRYSPSCHAFWAYSPTYSPCFFSMALDLEMERKVDWGDGWTHERTLHAIQECTADWTNALGGRTSGYRFRAVEAGVDGSNPEYTNWIHGGV